MPCPFGSRNSWFISALVLSLLVGFQNCSPVDSINFSKSDVNDTSALGPQPVVKTFVAGELRPIEIPLTGTKDQVPPDIKGLPKGSKFDATTRTILWLPGRGQAGKYEIAVHSDKTIVNPTELIRIEVSPASEAQLSKGPPGGYLDGDIGYVFVHGKGDMDRCTNTKALADYWGGSINLIAPNPAHRTVTCYDGRQEVAKTAAGVAAQILNASCGRFGKCIIITHSMGGLMVEHMFTHTREARASDPEPGMFSNQQLYQQVKDRTLFVISLASAAGGSKAASIVETPDNHSWVQYLSGTISQWVGADNGATRNLDVHYASNVVAPITEDPGVPFFMVAGYSDKIHSGVLNFVGGFFDFIGGAEPALFNGDAELAMIDRLTFDSSRGDGLVSFRSACGVASSNDSDGPGYGASLGAHIDYCMNKHKKPNHYAWFMINLNHSLITLPYSSCDRPSHPCQIRVAAPELSTFVLDAKLNGKSAVHFIRESLTAPSVSTARSLATEKISSP